MIIDIILDRREGAINYVPATHLKAIYDYATFFHMNNLATAVDSGNEDDVKAALMDYVISGGCNPDIHHHNFLDLCLFIKAVRWTEETEETEKTEDDAPAVAAEKLAIIRKVATRLRRKIKKDRLAIVHDRRLGNVDYLEAVEALTCGPLGTEDPEPTEILLSVTYGAGLPAEKADAIEDALLAAVKALPFPADDIFRGTGDGTREYTALFTL
jgi:hypothetical protein